MVGSEVSVAHGGRRRKGWVAEQEDTRTIVRLYPLDGESADFEIDNPRQVKVLKNQNPPRGWNAVDMLKAEDDSLWISLRFDDRFWDSMVQNAEDSNKTLEEMFKHYILSGLQRDEEALGHSSQA